MKKIETLFSDVFPPSTEKPENNRICIFHDSEGEEVARCVYDYEALRAFAKSLVKEEKQEDELIGIKEYAQKTGVSLRTIRKWIAKDEMPEPIKPLRLGKKIKLRKSEIKLSLDYAKLN